MPKYRTYATMSTDLVYEFTAKNDEEAAEIAKEADGGLFVEINGGGDWQHNYTYRVDKNGDSSKLI